ncbi:MAG: outer membrane lipoprotein [Paraglaciecola sp.]|jgi:outer membrane lipoprotein
MYSKISILLVALWITACSTLPEPIQMPDGAQLISYENAASSTEEAIGQKARWGGVIAKIENKSEKTMLELVYYPLASYGRPLAGDESIGRFRVYVNGFIDPMVYQKGRTMTFTGDFSGLEDGLVGEHQYVFPTLDASGYYLWKEIQRVDVNMISVWPYDYWRYGGYYNRPFNNRVILRSTTNRNRHTRSNKTPVRKTQTEEPRNR